MQTDILKRLENLVGDISIGPMRTVKTQYLADILDDAHLEILVLREAFKAILNANSLPYAQEIAAKALEEEK